MRYSFEFKNENVSNYIDKEYGPKRLKKVMKSSFRKKNYGNGIKLKKIRGPKGLKRVKKQRKWSQEEKLTFVLQVLNGENSYRGFFPSRN